MNTSGTFSMELEGKTSHTYSGIVTNITGMIIPKIGVPWDLKI